VRRTALTLWGPFLAALALVFWLSSLSDVPGSRHFWDKAIHAFIYAGLGVLALRAFHGGFTEPRPAPTLLAASAVILWESPTSSTNPSFRAGMRRGGTSSPMRSASRSPSASSPS